MAGGQFGLDGTLTFPQPVHGRVDLIGADRPEFEISHQGGVTPPLRRGQLRTGTHDAGEDQRVGDVALFARRSQQLGQTQRLGHDPDRGQVSMRQRTGQLQPRAGHHERLAGQAGPQRLEGGRGQSRDVAEGFVTDLAPVAKAAAQQMRDRLAVLPVLRLILAHDPGDVDRTILPSHTVILPYPLSDITIILATLSDPEETIGAAQKENQVDLRP